MTTPEGKIKIEVKKVLNKYNIYYFMPVNTGLGAAGLDFHCVMRVDIFPFAFFVETKKPGVKKVTERQELFIKERSAGQSAPTFIINSQADIGRLERWIQTLLEWKIQIIHHKVITQF